MSIVLFEFVVSRNSYLVSDYAGCVLCFPLREWCQTWHVTAEDEHFADDQRPTQGPLQTQHAVRQYAHRHTLQCRDHHTHAVFRFLAPAANRRRGTSPLRSKTISWDKVAHAEVVEDAEFLLISDLNADLLSSGWVGNVQLHCFFVCAILVDEVNASKILKNL